MKKFLTWCLVLLAVVGAGVALKHRMSAPTPAAPVAATTPADTSLPENGVVVTYFTTDVRCPSCHKIEELTRQTVETRFAESLKDGTLVFRSINTDHPANKHFVDDYQLVSKTVIVSFREGGRETRFENLQDVWLKLNDPDAFADYVAGAIP